MSSLGPCNLILIQHYHPFNIITKGKKEKKNHLETLRYLNEGSGLPDLSDVWPIPILYAINLYSTNPVDWMNARRVPHKGTLIFFISAHGQCGAGLLYMYYLHL